MEATTFSETTTSPVLLSVICEGDTGESEHTCFPLSCQEAAPWVVERHLVYLQMAGEGMVPHSVLLVLFLMEVLGKVPEVHGGGEEVVQVS